MQNSLIAIAVFLSVQAESQQTSTHFSYSVETSAAAEKIWQLWTDVLNWGT